MNAAGAPSAVDACEQAIRRDILRGELTPGERLPPERALAERFGVNRTTVRSALGRLASARLLSVRQGSGYVVRNYREVAGLELLPELAALALERGTGLDAIVRDLLAVRRSVATLVLERIVERPDRDRIQRVEGAVDRFAAAVERGAGEVELAEADLAVTASVLDATGSEVLGLVLNPITVVVEQLEPLRAAMYAEPETNVAAYRMLITWLRDPRPEAVALVRAELERRDAITVERVARATR